jgi:hypothetical protein
MKAVRILCFLLFGTAIALIPAAAQDTNSQNSKRTEGPAPMPTPLVYRNAQYGFCFRLPADWKGYTIVTQQWQGTLLTGNGQGSSAQGSASPQGSSAQGPAEHGPQLLIRNPQWTESDPWQDIPIMIFTPAQWKLVDAEDMAVSAAPIGPGKLGKNKSYVFALPPRWIGFYDAKGIDEVQALMNQNPFEAPCEKKGTQPGANVP